MLFIHQHLHIYQTWRRLSAQKTAHTPFHDMLPHLHTIYNDIIILKVLTEL